MSLRWWCVVMWLSVGCGAGVERSTPLRPERDCQGDDVVTVGFLGDLLLHTRAQQEQQHDPRGTQTLLAPIASLLAAPDLTVINVEGVTSCCRDAAGVEHPAPTTRYDGRVFTSWSRTGLNYPPAVMTDLAAVGVDLVQTANNHALDRGHFGAVATWNAAHAAGLVAIGTRAEPTTPWVVRRTVRGLRLAFLACTQWTNGPVDDVDFVRDCGIHLNNQAFVDDVAAAARSPDVDAVVVLLHAGRGSQPGPEPAYEAFARRLVDVGALAVIGGGRHVVQPWTLHTAPDGRQGVITWSLGDVTADRIRLDERVSFMIVVGLARDDAGGAQVVGIRTVPLVYEPPVSTTTRIRQVHIATPDAGTMVTDAGRAFRLVSSRVQRPHIATSVHDAIDVRPWCRRGVIGDSCSSDSDCLDELVCDVELHGGTCSRVCGSGASCPGGAVCSDERCVAGCLSDDDCPVDFRCRRGCIPTGAHP